jgi:hypothetical protein
MSINGLDETTRAYSTSVVSLAAREARVQFVPLPLLPYHSCYRPCNVPSSTTSQNEPSRSSHEYITRLNVEDGDEMTTSGAAISDVVTMFTAIGQGKRRLQIPIRTLKASDGSLTSTKNIHRGFDEHAKASCEMR